MDKTKNAAQRLMLRAVNMAPPVESQIEAG
jgi:hypothetical protein